jgi:hypothetical protein
MTLLVEGVHYNIHDNFLPKEDFLVLKNYILSSDFPWYYTNTINGHLYEDSVTNEKYDFFFSHLFYTNSLVNSPHMQILNTLLTKINAISLIRVKANLYSRTDEIIQHGWHVDFKDVKFKSAVFYINTNNGKTILKDGICVNSVENRLFVFDTDLLHCSTSCTDEKIRCNINLNYVAFPKTIT